MTTLTPFADEAASVTIDGLTVENGIGRLALYGSLTITRDKAGLVQARALQTILDQAVKTMDGDPHLPDRLPSAAKPATVRNPFA